MRRVVVTSYARTPIGAFLGDLKTVPVQELAKVAFKAAVERSNIEDLGTIDGSVFGHVISSPEAGNLGRLVNQLAGCPETVPGFTVNRICGSGLQATVCAAQEIWTDNADIYVAGGAESLSRVPYYLPLNYRYEGIKNGNKLLLCSNEEMCKHTHNEELYGPIESMGETAENIVAKYDIPREDADLFAYQSQMKCKKAVESGRFEKEIVPVTVVKNKKKGIVEVVDKDGHPRPQTTLEGLAALKPCFKKDGRVTAGNSSGMNDAGAALVLMSEEKCLSLGLKPLAYINAYAFGGVDPRVMGLGPVPAVNRLLQKTGLKLEDIDILEINEAFAAQVLGCCKEWGNYIGTPLYERINPNGGACALGHPLGMTGARLVGTTVIELNETGKKYGIATACIGGGQGAAILIENAMV